MRKGRNPVAKLSKALQQYKTERIGTEDALIKCIKKVNLDKAILFKEKQGVLWGDFNDNSKEKALDQTMLEMELRREKQLRHDLNVRQKEAYFKLLEFMKERGTKPVQEEKQILDGIKIVLDNGYIMRTEETIVFFDTLNLRTKMGIT